MTAEHIAFRLAISFMVPFYSGLPGLWMARILREKNETIFNAVKNYQLTSHALVYDYLGIGFFAYCIRKTFLKRFNTKIKITKRPDIDGINNLLDELTISELCHILGCMFVLIIQTVILCVQGWYDVLLFMTIFNTIFNLYPVLLQERNKLRLKALLSTLQRQ